MNLLMNGLVTCDFEMFCAVSEDLGMYDGIGS